MTGSERWRDNWLAVSPTDGIHVHVWRSRPEREESRRNVAALPPGTPVVLTSSAPGASSRCRSFASDAGILVEREYLALPSAKAPAYLVEDARESVSVFVQSVLCAPPGLPFKGVIEAGLRVIRALQLWRLVRAAAPGRVVVGRCG